VSTLCRKIVHFIYIYVLLGFHGPRFMEMVSNPAFFSLYASGSLIHSGAFSLTCAVLYTFPLWEIILPDLL